MTLIELLVAVSIIGVLAGILIPAVMSAREAGRRMQCENNLHQLGVALNAFESAHGHFPSAAPGQIETVAGHTGLGIPRLHSPLLQILGFLDSQDVAQAANLTLPSDNGDRPENETAMSVHLSVFLCPSETSPLLQGSMGPASYRVNLGPGPYITDDADHPIGKHPWGGMGAFRFGHVVRPAEFTDGLNQTVMMSEKLMGDGAAAWFTPIRDYWCVGLSELNYPTADDLVAICSQPPSLNPPHVSTGGRSWYTSGFDDTFYNHTVTPNSRVPGCKVNGTYPTPDTSGNFGGVFGASSLHGGGVNCLMGDGSVRFAKDSVNLQVWRAASTRSGGEGNAQF